MRTLNVYNWNIKKGEWFWVKNRSYVSMRATVANRNKRAPETKFQAAVEKGKVYVVRVA